jgi:hypothetical protein
MLLKNKEMTIFEANRGSALLAIGYRHTQKAKLKTYEKLPGGLGGGSARRVLRDVCDEGRKALWVCLTRRSAPIGAIGKSQTQGSAPARGMDRRGRQRLSGDMCSSSTAGTCWMGSCGRLPPAAPVEGSGCGVGRVHERAAI